MECVLRIDGQERPIDPALASASDNYAKLRKIMATIFPLIGNATISQKKEGDRTVVTVVKRADVKGRRKTAALVREAGAPYEEEILSGIYEKLESARPEENAALAFTRSLRRKLAEGRISLTQLQNRRKGIERVVKAGEEEQQRVKAIASKLAAASPVPSAVVPAGF